MPKYYVCNEKISSKKDMKSNGLIRTSKADYNNKKTTHQLVKYNQVKDAFIIKNFAFPNICELKNEEEIGIGDIPTSKDVDVLNIQYGYITKFKLKNTIISSDNKKIYIPYEQMTALKMTDLDNKNNIIYLDEEWNEKNKLKQKQFLESFK